jgi:hypothetical protein
MELTAGLPAIHRSHPIILVERCGAATGRQNSTGQNLPLETGPGPLGNGFWRPIAFSELGLPALLWVKIVALWQMNNGQRSQKKN